MRFPLQAVTRRLPRTVPQLALWTTLVAVVVLLTLGLAARSASAGSVPDVFVVDDFEDGDTVGPADAPWNAHDDTYLDGGASSSVLTVVDEGATDGSAKALRVEGQVRDGFSAPFAGANVLLEPEGSGHDLSSAQGLRFYVRGDGQTYLAQVLTTIVQDFNEFSKTFVAPEDWTLVEIPFDELAQSPYWGKQVKWTSEGIRGVSFQTSPAIRGDFHLEIDEIEFYGAD